MLVLDFINVGNGDSILIREMQGAEQRFAMLVDCGHDHLVRDDHPALTDDRSCRIYAGDFLRKQGVTRLDLLVLTHFHRDHIGGLGKILDAVTVDELACTYFPPENNGELHPDDNDLPKAARNLLRCLDLYAEALRSHPGRIARRTELSGAQTESRRPTEKLSFDIQCNDPALYPRQKAVYDAMFRGERNHYDLMHWGKCMNVSSLHLRLHYCGKEIVLGGDAYGVLWDTDTTAPCDILKVPHHASLSSANRKFFAQLQPKTAVVSVAAGRPDERPHPYIISLLREYAREVYFTDAVDLPGLVEPVYHESVHMELGE